MRVDDENLCHLVCVKTGWRFLADGPTLWDQNVQNMLSSREFLFLMSFVGWRHLVDNMTPQLGLTGRQIVCVPTLFTIDTNRPLLPLLLPHLHPENQTQTNLVTNSHQSTVLKLANTLNGAFAHPNVHHWDIFTINAAFCFRAFV